MLRFYLIIIFAASSFCNQSDAFASNGDEKHQHTLPSTRRKRKEKSRDTVLQTPVRRGQHKRTRSAVGPKWDLLVALQQQQHKAVEKSHSNRNPPWFGVGVASCVDFG